MVIGIIALLAAIIFPVFATARGKARQTACLSNLRQVGMAIGMYADDYDDLYPNGQDPADKYTGLWGSDPATVFRINTMPFLHEVLQPYIKSRDIFRCPSDSGFDVVDDLMGFDGQPAKLPARPSCYEKYGTSYFYRTALAFEGKLYSTTGGYDAAPPYAEHGPTELIILFDADGKWHGGPVAGRRYNSLFADGHAKNLDRDKYYASWDLELSRPGG